MSLQQFSSSMVNHDNVAISKNFPQTLIFKNLFEQLNNWKENESIFNEKDHNKSFKSGKMETSNAISLKSRSNPTSNSSPFSEKPSSRSFAPNDQINLLPNVSAEQTSIIERLKPGSCPSGIQIPKTNKSDKIGSNSNSNNDITNSLPMFYSQMELMKKDQVIDKDVKTGLSGFYAKARNRLNEKNSQIISKNVILFSKIRHRNEISDQFFANMAKRLQIFMKDLTFFTEGYQGNRKICSFKQKLRNYITKVMNIVLKPLDGLIAESFDRNYVNVCQQSFRFLYLVLLPLYSIILPIKIAFNNFPFAFIIVDTIFFFLLIIRFLSLHTIKSDKFLYKLRFLSLIFGMVTFISYLTSLNDFLSLCFFLFSFEELAFFLTPKLPFESFLPLAFFECFSLYNFLCCFWLLIGNHAIINENTWLERHQIQNLENFGKYLNSFNYVLTLPFAKEYNSVIFEQIFSIIASFLTFFMVIHLGFKITVFQQERSKKISKTETEGFEPFLRKMQVFGNLRKEILDFVGKALENQRKKEEIERSLNLLSHDLRTKIIINAYMNSFRKVKVLVKYFSAEFLQRLLMRVKILQKKPQEPIFQQGEMDNQGLFIVDEGEIELYYRSPNSVLLNVAQKGDILGELAFFSNFAHEFTALSKDFSTLLLISREDFIETLRLFPKDFEIYNMLKDKINIYKSPAFLQSSCFFCEDQNHIPRECPSILPNPNRRMIIFSRIYANSFIQRRKLYRRIRTRRFPSLKELSAIQEQAFLILERHRESVSILLDDIYPSSECGDNTENQINVPNVPFSNSNDSDGNQIQEKSISESKESKAELAAFGSQEKKIEEGLINPPSIFLQPTSKNKRKSTGSIFEERKMEDEAELADDDNEQMENDRSHSLELQESEKKKSEMNLLNEDITKQTLSEGNMIYIDEKKNTKLNSSSLPSDKFYSEKDSSINLNSFKNNSRAKELQKILSSERESKFFTEKDTMHFLQNFDKLEKKAFLDKLNTSSHKTNNTTFGTEKRNLPSIFSYSKSNSHISSWLKLIKKKNTANLSNPFKPTHNKKTNYSDYLKYPLFWYEFEKMAQFENYYPHNNVENVVKVIKGNVFLKLVNYSESKCVRDLKKSVRSNQANTSYSSKKTSQKSRALHSAKTNENETEVNARRESEPTK